jgi:hypothetical protein
VNQCSSIIIAGVVREPLDCILVCRDVHDGNAWDFANTALQVFVASGNDVALVHVALMDKAIIRIAQA